MPGRRQVLLGSLSALVAAPAGAVPALADTADIAHLGKFKLVLGRPGVVVGVPHGTPDTGTYDTGQVFCERLRAGGVFVTGFWDAKTRQRINVNRPTEQIIGPESRVVRQWPSERAAAANARYVDLVKQAAQGKLRMFFEIHSNSRPRYANSIEVSTLGLDRSDAVRLKEAFAAMRARLDPDIPRLEIRVSPVDKVTYPNYAAASSIAKVSGKGCAIENPGRVFANRRWRLAYAACLAAAIEAAHWS